MLRFLCKKLITRRIKASSTIINGFSLLHTESLKSNSESETQTSLTVSYLTSSCGFSPESALSASKKICIKSTEKSDSVIELFRTHGFTEIQIRSFITKRPRLLLSKPDKTIEPKIEFFKSLGISTNELANILSREPLLLLRSLNKLGLSLDFLRTFVRTEENLFRVIKQLYRYLQCNLEKRMSPNISILRAHGVPEPIIARLIMIQPTSLMLNTDRFELSVGVAEKLGFKPTSIGFILAVRTMVVVSESNWEKKMETYKRTGWSKEEIVSAFKVQPLLMLPSDKKIRKMMDFFTNQLRWAPGLVAKCPNLLLLSLEKRIVPRCCVLEVLVSNGLLKKDKYVPQVFKLTEKSFMEGYVRSYQSVVPEVVKAYKGEIEFQGFSCEFKDGVLKVGVKSTPVLEQVSG